MTLSVSDDEGLSWFLRHDLEAGDGWCLSNNSREDKNREKSYPSIIQGGDGRLHIAYTWRYKVIKYIAFAVLAL